MTQPMPCTHPESMWTHHTTGRRTIIRCHRPGCGHIISDTATGICRVPYVLVGQPDRIALCGLERGHPEPDHEETP
jgi:hypothetical protein